MELMPNCVDNAIKNLTNEPAMSIGTLIKDAIYLKFGSISYKAEKRRLYEKYGLIELEARLKLCIEQIPSEKLIEPDYQTIMLALDNVDSCINSEELRNLFANLIARSCHSDYKELIHPSFSETLKQMSPYDAKILKYYVSNKPERLITYTYFNNSENDFYNKVPYTFDTYPNQHEARYISFSLSSLMRLGILAFDDDALVHPADDSPFKNSDFYKQCEEERIKTGKYLHSEIVGKICGLTPFGTALIQACLD